MEVGHSTCVFGELDLHRHSNPIKYSIFLVDPDRHRHFKSIRNHVYVFSIPKITALSRKLIAELLYLYMITSIALHSTISIFYLSGSITGKESKKIGS